MICFYFALRCSLSVDDYSDLRTNASSDDTKYDSESGYLSYHRYNSVECDNEDHNRRQSQPCNDTEGAKGDPRRSSLNASSVSRRHSHLGVENTKNHPPNQLKTDNIARRNYNEVDQESNDGYVFCHKNDKEFEEYETVPVHDRCDSASENDD